MEKNEHKKADATMQVVPVTNHRITSKTLFNKTRELVIEHEGHEYKLRITANNKLILTK